MQRRTIQCAIVLDTVKQLKNHATADEIYDEIIKKHPAIGRSTVYRNLQKLCDQGKIQKRVIPGKADCYDHDCQDHYHIRCLKCDRVFDVDMDHLSNLENAVSDKHGFVFTGHDITFTGICPECGQKA